MHYLGIDWADEKHDVCLLAADGRILSQFSIPNDLYGFQKLDQRLNKIKDLKINIERSDGLLVDWLVSQGRDICVTVGTSWKCEFCKALQPILRRLGGNGCPAQDR